MTTASGAYNIPAPPTIIIPPKTSGAEKTYIWMPDAKGNLVKAEASTVKKAFANLPTDAVLALQTYLITIEKKAAPTASMRESLWNRLVDGAIASFKDGNKQSPWDVLDTITKTSPELSTDSISYTKYDDLTANALLKNISDSIQFDFASLTDADKADYITKLNEQAQASGKTVTRVVTGGGTETVTTPSIFNAKDFTNSWLWTRVNIDNPDKLPGTAITQISSIRSLLKDYSINNLSTKEINQLGVDLASGSKTVPQLQAEFSAKAQKNYPLYAERLAANPKLTVRDVLEPVINVFSKYWEQPADTIPIDADYVEQFARPDGTVGKAAAPSIADVIAFAKNHPNAEKTTWANEMARDLAVGASRAMGFGL
jgi:hypothetical protein